MPYFFIVRISSSGRCAKTATGLNNRNIPMNLAQLMKKRPTADKSGSYTNIQRVPICSKLIQ